MNSIVSGLKNYFTQSHFASVSDIIEERRAAQEQEEINTAFALSHVFIMILMVTIIVFGFMAVQHLCDDNTERGKNTRLGMYILLLLSGGQIGWLYIILWIAKINICA